MNFMNMLLDTTTVENGWNGTTFVGKYAFLNPIISILKEIIIPIVIVIASVGVIYAIYLGVLMAKAENAEKREEAKKRIINVVIAIVITLALIGLMELFINFAPSIIGSVQDDVANTSGVIGLLK